MVSLSLQSKCEMCISMNSSAAIESGAKKEKILEAARLSVVMGGGPVMMYMESVLAEFEY
jgi:AhpD family alkylhydroperoxidase